MVINITILEVITSSIDALLPIKACTREHKKSAERTAPSRCAFLRQISDQILQGSGRGNEPEYGGGCGVDLTLPKDQRLHVGLGGAQASLLC